ncbi:MAG: hypothetical protein RLZZ139_1137, partial [Cyanobacteriota bacterium]
MGIGLFVQQCQLRISLLTFFGREARFLMMGKRGKGARLRPDFQPRDLPRG